MPRIMKRFIAILTSFVFSALIASGTVTDAMKDVLSTHGTWLDHPNHGECWQPTAAKKSDWRPYTQGKWIHTNHGWTWDSNEPFGSITYHYGRWANDTDAGWLWVSGDQWAPAWVAWRYGTEFVGWAPLPPKSLEFPKRSWGNNVDALLSIAPNDYAFVKTKDFTNITSYTLVPRDENLHCIYQTSNVTQIKVGQTHVLAGGPQLQQINQVLEIDLPSYQLDKSKTLEKSRIVASSPKFAEASPADESSKPTQLTELKSLAELKGELSALQNERAKTTTHTRITVYDGPSMIYSPEYYIPYQRSSNSRSYRSNYRRSYIQPATYCRPQTYYYPYRHHNYSRCDTSGFRASIIIR